MAGDEEWIRIGWPGGGRWVSRVALGEYNERAVAEIDKRFKTDPDWAASLAKETRLRAAIQEMPRESGTTHSSEWKSKFRW